MTHMTFTKNKLQADENLQGKAMDYNEQYIVLLEKGIFSIGSVIVS